MKALPLYFCPISPNYFLSILSSFRWYYQWWSYLFTTSGTYAFESCNAYPNYTYIDPAWKAARAFGIISFIFSVIMLVTACISGCANNRGYALTHVWEAPMYLLTAICQGLVLLLLSSNACNNYVLNGLGFSDELLSNVSFSETCTISTGAKLVISATVFWFCAAVASFLAHRAEIAEAGEPDKRFEGEAEKAAEEGEAEIAAEEGEAGKAAEVEGAENAADEGEAGKVAEDGEAEKGTEQAAEAQ
mmetsp:Transcript_34560/g.73632  ORF Transcript_34560/g.73632 Transcript_34560/m.73632 type:complete len:246 (-) Transcript_34560:156-893(-)